ncbi:hypothetical protein AVEN_236554-1 [Araneus ventricosus]|uniref:Uncharacterized protein n=1 Tax=Araneus ventricosus TaxID=182803 RepID=A0A4Y2LJ16_ARAVE|nr:hypothetical protein AVEN_236554-1 [Araneus ventricosus]
MAGELFRGLAAATGPIIMSRQTFHRCIAENSLYTCRKVFSVPQKDTRSLWIQEQHFSTKKDWGMFSSLMSRVSLHKAILGESSSVESTLFGTNPT